MPAISIIIPVFNVVPYIEECLGSIQNQTFKDFECLLINDGSEDESGDICNRYSQEDKHFNVIHKENGGVSSARNAGLDKVTGEYIAFVDADDIIAPDFYAKLHQAINENDADMAESGITKFAKGYALSLARSGECVYEDALEAILEYKIDCCSWNKLFKRSLWGNARYPVDLSMGEDAATVLSVCQRAKRVVYVPDAVYYHRVREGSLMNGTVTLERYHELRRGTEIMRQQFLKQAPEKESKINAMKSMYDLLGIACYLNSSKKGEKGSILYRCFKD